MPGEGAFNKIFSSAFVINEPLNVVGRNGYWLYQRDEIVFLAVFACAGRGHLASMMTRIYANSLKRLVVDHNVQFPGSILGFIHREIRSKFKSRERFILHTGADLGILRVDLSSRQMEFAGAKMDLIQVVNNKIEIIQGDNISIGPESENQITYHTRSVSAGASACYLHTEGLTKLVVEQAYSKLGKSGVKSLINKVHRLPMERQKKALSGYFEKWSAASRKTDDILLLGLKF